MDRLKVLAKTIRYYSLVMSTEAGSGHPTSSLSATDLMTSLFFDNYFRFNLQNPRDFANDRLIFSKGHASPLFYSLWAAAGGIEYDELLTYRKFESRLEGHPTLHFPFTEAATGSLGQGLSIGVGMALAIKLRITDYELGITNLPKVFVLLGDSEFAEGQIYEALELASFYKLNNLIGILDVNRLGQSRETMLGWDIEKYKKRVESFGWQTICIEDGHDFSQIKQAFNQLNNSKDKPLMIIAKTVKGKGISFLENAENWHGKALKKEDLEKALKELGEVDKTIVGTLEKPKSQIQIPDTQHTVTNYELRNYELNETISTRRVYGDSLLEFAKQNPNIIALDGETSNSTYSETLKKLPDRFFEMFIAEQNMVSTALGLSKYGYIPFVSTFTAFFTRAFDQIRMAQYSNANIKFIGSHGGVSIGQDGSSQMGLEDLSMFSSILESIVLYPSDAISTQKLLFHISQFEGISYMRTTRMDLPVIYENAESFEIGGSKTLFTSQLDKVTVVSAGVTLHEAIKAYHTLKKSNINIRVIDLYSIKPIDEHTLLKAFFDTQAIITVEDHYPLGGLGDAVVRSLAPAKLQKPIYKLSVSKQPKSGKPEELLRFEEIDAEAIVKKVKEIV